MDPFVAVTAVVAGVGSLVGLLLAAQVRAHEISDSYRRALWESLRG
ncbi:MAG TPA: hypothetical protein VLS92_02320 [Acidimicrobiia bacterium]|nr:hypothetical protein [Acidimicrobiia bacterium]